MLDHLQQAWIAAKQVVTEIGAALDEIFLILPIGDFAQPPHQNPVAIVADQTVPVASPNHLDDIPASPTEDRLQLLDDFAIAAHRSVQALQVAVHYENQIV